MDQNRIKIGDKVDIPFTYPFVLLVIGFILMAVAGYLYFFHEGDKRSDTLKLSLTLLFVGIPIAMSAMAMLRDEYYQKIKLEKSIRDLEYTENRKKLKELKKKD